MTSNQPPDSYLGIGIAVLGTLVLLGIGAATASPSLTSGFASSPMRTVDGVQNTQVGDLGTALLEPGPLPAASIATARQDRVELAADAN